MNPDNRIKIFPNGKYAMLEDDTLTKLPDIPESFDDCAKFVSRSIVREDNIIHIHNWNVKYVVDVERAISINDIFNEIMEVSHGPLSTMTKETVKSKVNRIVEEAISNGETVKLILSNWI